MIVPFHKRERTECENYRNDFLSVVGKVFKAKVLVERVREITDGLNIEE